MASLVLTLFVKDFVFYPFKTSLLHFPVNGICNVADNCNVCLLHILAASLSPVLHLTR